MPKIEHCSGIVPFRKLNDKWQVLLALHVKGDYWAFPKGHYDKEESPKAGAVRELFEETNLEVESFLDSTPLKEDYQFVRGGEKIHKYVEYFPAMVKGELLLKEPHEIKELKWFSFEDALHQITFDPSKALLKKVVEIIY